MMPSGDFGFFKESGQWVNQCPGCGHIFYQGGSGYCRWCMDEFAEEGRPLILQQVNPIKIARPTKEEPIKIELK